MKLDVRIIDLNDVSENILISFTIFNILFLLAIMIIFNLSFGVLFIWIVLSYIIANICRLKIKRLK